MLCKEVISLSFGNHMQPKNKFTQGKVLFVKAKQGGKLLSKGLQFQILGQSKGRARPFLSSAM